MSWCADFKEDIGHFQRHGGGNSLKLVLTEQGLWALLQYRLHRAVYTSSMPALARKPLHLVLTIARKFVEIATGMSLPCTARLGPGLHLPHCGTRVFNAGAVVGRGCCIAQGVTLGVSGRGDRRGNPVIGDRVYIGVNAVVAGKIHVGDDALIGANSLVNRDVPPHSTVLGVPAVVISERGSADYLGDAPPRLITPRREAATCGT